MKHSLPLLFLLAGALLSPACGGGTTTVTTPTPIPAFSGTWTGTATDSTGTPLATGASGTAGAMTWTLTRTGNQVSGTVTITGVVPKPGQPTITVDGTVSANVWTFTITVPAGEAVNPVCVTTINGTLTLATTGDVMTGSYSGTNPCSGAIVNGQITLRRQ